MAKTLQKGRKKKTSGKKVAKKVNDRLLDEHKARCKQRYKDDAAFSGELYNLTKIANGYRSDLLKKRTVFEKIAYKALSDLGVNFVEQKIFYYGPSFYITDFYLPKYKMVIEIDGGYHDDEEVIIKDHQRSLNLKSLGVRTILRIRNEDCDLTNVKNTVKEAVRKDLEGIVFEESLKEI